MLDAEGQIVAWSEDAAEWLAMEGLPEALSERAGGMKLQAATRYTSAFERVVIDLLALDGAAGGYLANLEPIEPLRAPLLACLSAAQLKIAAFAAAGATVPEIARAVGRSENTVRTHLKNIYARLEVASRLELAWLFENLWSMPR